MIVRWLFLLAKENFTFVPCSEFSSTHPSNEVRISVFYESVVARLGSLNVISAHEPSLQAFIMLRRLLGMRQNFIDILLYDWTVACRIGIRAVRLLVLRRPKHRDSFTLIRSLVVLFQTL